MHRLRLGRPQSKAPLHPPPISSNVVVKIKSYFKICSHSYSGPNVLIRSSPQESSSQSTPAFCIWWLILEVFHPLSLVSWALFFLAVISLSRFLRISYLLMTCFQFFSGAVFLFFLSFFFFFYQTIFSANLVGYWQRG